MKEVRSVEKIIDNSLRGNDIYNKDLKVQYLKTLYSSNRESPFSTILMIFRNTNSFEKLNEKDLCRFYPEELKVVFEKSEWAAQTTVNSYLSLIRDYVRYCNEMFYKNDPNKKIFELRTDDIQGILKYKRFYKEEQEFADTVEILFKDIKEKETLGSGIRPLIAMIFSYYGIEYVYSIREEQFDFQTMKLKYSTNTKTITISFEKYKDIFLHYKNLVLNKDVIPLQLFFKKEFPPYYKGDKKDLQLLSQNKIWKTRNSIMNDKRKLQNILNRLSLDNPLRNKELDFQNIWYSGMFYWIYKKEKELNLSNQDKIKDLVVNYVEEMSHKNKKTGLYNYYKNYESWKNAFNLL